MPVERADWTDGPPSEVAPIEKPDIGRTARPDWTAEPLAPAVEAPAAESTALDPVAGVAPDRPDWTGEENVPTDPQPVPNNAMHPSDVVPDSIFASPDDVGAETAPALNMAKAVLAEDAGWKNTIAGFTEHLSSTAQDVLVAEMAGGPVEDVQPLTPDQIVAFTSTPVGRELWEEWGDAAPEHAAMARARLDRLIGKLPEHEIAMFDALFEALPPAAFKEAMRQLTG